MNEQETLIEHQDKMSKPLNDFDFDGFRKALSLIDLNVDIGGAELIFLLADTYKKVGDSLSIGDVNELKNLVAQKRKQQPA